MLVRDTVPHMPCTSNAKTHFVLVQSEGVVPRDTVQKGADPRRFTSMASGSSVRPALVYFADGKGRNELTRLIFAVGHIEYDDQLIDLTEYTELRNAGKLPMGQLPVLRMGDSASSVLPQSCAIARYAAKCGTLLSWLISRVSGAQGRTEVTHA